MGERIESRLAVIGTKSALSESAERHVRGCKVNYYVVYAAASEPRFGKEFFNRFLVGREVVCRKGTFAAVHGFYDLVKVVVRQYGHNRTENLLAHDLVVGRDAVHDGGGYAQTLLVALSAEHYFFCIDQPCNPVEVLFGNYSAIVLVFKRICAVLSDYLFFDLFDEPVLYRGVAEYVVGSNAGLTAVQIFSEHYAPCRKRNICRCVDNAGALAAKLQCDGSKSRSRLFVYLSSHGLAARKEYIVKVEVEENFVFLPAALDYGDYLFGQSLGNYLSEHGRGGGGVSARLEYDSISCRNRLGNGVEGKKYGIVPRAHNQHRAVGRRIAVALGYPLRHRGGYPLSFGKFLYVLYLIGNFAQ